MIYLLIGLVTGLIGGFPFDFGRSGWKMKWLILTSSVLLVNAVISYFAMPQLIGPFFGWPIVLMAGLSLIPNVIWSWVGYTESRDAQAAWHEYSPGNATVACFVIVLLCLIGDLRGCGAFRASDYSALVGDTIEKREWQKDIQPIDTAHIRMVSQKQAEWRANKTFGQTQGSLGSQFKLGTLTIQKVKDELVWVAPLEFQGFKAWTNADVTPGYVITSAQDPSHEAKLVTGHKFRYVPSAYFGDNLERHLYENGFLTRGTTDYVLEIDDDGNPFYVVTIFQPTIGYGGEVVEGVAVVNPETGDITEYSVDTAPAWIDRMIPESFAHDRLVSYGEYADGWWNSVWGKKNINKPTESELHLVWADDGKAYWFTGITSVANSDQSLIAFVLMDSRTGATREYELQGSDEKGVVQAVNASVSNYSGWEATDPILYNIYGEFTWVVPVVSNGIFQKLALVRAVDVQVTLGDNKNDILGKYRVALQRNENNATPTAESTVRELSGVVERFGCGVIDGNTICSLMIAGSPHIFTATPSLSAELVLTQLGDHVAFAFVETSEAVVPLRSWNIKKIRASP